MQASMFPDRPDLRLTLLHRFAWNMHETQLPAFDLSAPAPSIHVHGHQSIGDVTQESSKVEPNTTLAAGVGGCGLGG